MNVNGYHVLCFVYIKKASSRHTIHPSFFPVIPLSAISFSPISYRLSSFCVTMCALCVGVGVSVFLGMVVCVCVFFFFFTQHFLPVCFLLATSFTLATLPSHGRVISSPPAASDVRVVALTTIDLCSPPRQQVSMSLIPLSQSLCLSPSSICIFSPLSHFCSSQLVFPAKCFHSVFQS